MEEAVDEMAAYVCDKVCRYGTDGSLDQRRLDGICAECEMGNHVCRILNEHIRGSKKQGRAEKYFLDRYGYGQIFESTLKAI